MHPLLLELTLYSWNQSQWVMGKRERETQNDSIGKSRNVHISSPPHTYTYCKREEKEDEHKGTNSRG